MATRVGLVAPGQSTQPSMSSWCFPDSVQTAQRGPPYPSAHCPLFPPPRHDSLVRLAQGRICREEGARRQNPSRRRRVVRVALRGHVAPFGHELQRSPFDGRKKPESHMEQADSPMEPLALLVVGGQRSHVPNESNVPCSQPQSPPISSTRPAGQVARAEIVIVEDSASINDRSKRPCVGTVRRAAYPPLPVYSKLTLELAPRASRMGRKLRSSEMEGS